MKFRVKEMNHSYDRHFGRGKGWIFVSEPIDFWPAIVFAWYRQIKTGFVHKIEFCANESPTLLQSGKLNEIEPLKTFDE